MNYDFETLEFFEFKKLLSLHFSSAFARKKLEALYPYQNLDDILGAQKEFKDALEISEDGKFIEDDSAYFNSYSKFNDEVHFSFEIPDYVILKRFLFYIADLKAKVAAKKTKSKILKQMIEELNELAELRDDIERAIDDNYEIKDNATAELRNIRKGLNENKNRIKKILNDTLNSSNASKFIQDNVIVLRSGRYTIPCKTNFGQYIEGIIHDKSTSGQTLYIEPSSCVAANNAMQELIIKESEEIAKILYNLLMLLKSSRGELDILTESYAHVAFRMETAYFYKDKPITFPEFANDVIFKSIHHPLLYMRKAQISVPIDLEILDGVRTVVITGPNTGGKTVALKSAGLNHIIAYCGFALFGKSAVCTFFDSILADIGDKQSLVMDLSTFSSHMINIKRIIESAKGKSLILFDELGTGTEPREGASIAVAVLRQLSRKNAISIVTTHFAEVKNYALNDKSAIFYSVDFDYETFEPRYRLIKDVLGKSDPIMIAERLGFDKNIINEAKLELSKYKSSVEMQVEELNMLLAEANHTKRILEEKEKELELRLEGVNQNEATLKKRLNSKELELLEEAYSLLQRGKRIADSKIKVNAEEIEEEIKETAKKIEKIKSERKTITDIGEGDLIFLERYGKKAKVVSIAGDILTLNMDGLKVKINKKDAVGYKVEKEKPKNVKISSAGAFSTTRHEILLVGKRVEEAQDLLDKFIDEALISSYDKVYIIHGRGSGQLRKAVHDYLRKHRSVKRFALAENNEGGNAITVAEL